LASLLLAGCQVNTTQLGGDFRPSNHSSKKNRKSQADIQCPIKLEKYQDLRRSKSLGTVAFTIVENDVEKWVKSAMAHYNIKETNDTNVSRIEVSLVKAYIQSMLTSMSANVVLSVKQYDVDTGQYGKRMIFRGHDVSTNWNSGDGEISATLNQAISNALLKIKVSMRELCRKEEVA
jgi:hypothetical protein